MSFFPDILNPIKQLRDDMVSDLHELAVATQHLSAVLTVRLHAILGNESLQHAATMHKIEQPLIQILEKEHAAIRSLRRVQKHARPLHDFSDAAMKSEVEFYKHSAASIKESIDVKPTRIYVNTQRALALKKHPARWVSGSFSAHFEEIMVTRWRSHQSTLYSLTKFSISEDTTPRVEKLRNTAFSRFRKLLDSRQFKLPHPYGHHGNDDQDIFTLVRQLKWIRDYRIERFLESVSREEIQSARNFYIRMQKELFNRGHRYARKSSPKKRKQTRLNRKPEKEQRKSEPSIEKGASVATFEDTMKLRDRITRGEERYPRLSRDSAKKLEASRAQFVAEKSKASGAPVLAIAFQPFQRKFAR